MKRKKKKPAKKEPAVRQRAKRKRDSRTIETRQQALIEEYAATCDVTAAAKRARVPRKTHYNWLHDDSAYAEAFRKVRVQAGEHLETVAVERATKGWLEPIYYQGARCGSVRRYDGGLLQFLLRGTLPEKYGHKTEISGPEGAPLQAKVEVVFIKPHDAGNRDQG